MDRVEGPLHILLVEKRGNPSYLTNYISSFFFSLSFWVLHRWGRKREHDGSYWHNREEYCCIDFILMFAHDYATCAWYATSPLNGELENALILSICSKGMKTNKSSLWAFGKIVRFTNRLVAKRVPNCWLWPTSWIYTSLISQQVITIWSHNLIDFIHSKK